VIVVTSEGLVRVDNRKSRGTGGDGESDSNKYEDFFHGRILSKGGGLNYITATRAATTLGYNKHLQPRTLPPLYGHTPVPYARGLITAFTIWRCKLSEG
jgi:hypothetical protein